MRSLLFRPPLFLLTGLVWLIASSFVGLTLFLGMLLGLPLPPMLRPLHVHGALVGGIAQIILGAVLASPVSLGAGRERLGSHPVLFATINLATVSLLIGLALKHGPVIGVSGLFIILALLSRFPEAVRQAKSSLVSPSLNLWLYGVAFLALLVGLGLGEAIAFRLLPNTLIGQGRLAHLHLSLLGFVILVSIGTMHNLFPAILNTRLYSPSLAQLTFFIVPAAIAALIAGFLLAKVPLQIGAGSLLFVGLALYGYNIVRTWTGAGRPQGVVSDHVLLATLFLLLSVISGILVSVNYLWDPPAVPFGTLHLAAYTHLALVGFLVQTTIGGLSYLLPAILAIIRTKSSKKRKPYLAELSIIAERWRAIQVGSLALGTIGLALVAAMVWQFNLSSLPVQIAGWASAGLLMLGLGVFAVKVSLLLASRPSAE